MILLALLAATSFQDLGALDRAVAAFTGRPIGAEGGARSAIDPRLRLASCPTVSLSWRTEARDAVVATCTGPNWRVFIAVNAAPRASGTAPAVALPVPIPIVAKAPPVIKRGDPVVIEAGSSGFSIAREGLAMGDAPAGARLLVRVDGARGPVQAVAVAAGRATLPGWGE